MGIACLSLRKFGINRDFITLVYISAASNVRSAHSESLRICRIVVYHKWNIVFTVNVGINIHISRVRRCVVPLKVRCCGCIGTVVAVVAVRKFIYGELWVVCVSLRNNLKLCIYIFVYACCKFKELVLLVNWSSFLFTCHLSKSELTIKPIGM